jgi:hypothetical protein
MTALPMNNGFANGELSVEELEAIAAGWPHWLHSAVNWVEHHPIDTVIGAGFVALGVAAIASGNPSIVLGVISQVR